MNSYKIIIEYPQKNQEYDYYEDFCNTTVESFDNDCDAVMHAIEKGKEYRKTTDEASVTVIVRKTSKYNHEWVDTILDIMI